MIRPGSRSVRKPNSRADGRRVIGLLGLLLSAILPLQAAPQWIEHASNPAADMAPQGQSRFDDLFRRADGSYRLPYPFTELIADLESRLDTASGAGVRRVFVPLGRSLQRETAAPDYFRQSREVITLEGEPRPAPSQAGRVLEYRLFIAHQPSSETLEVISYNDAAGRFEFQVVENYAARHNPRVRPARRVMCMSCHQNAAPIFAERPWSETSFNVAIAKRMIEALPERYSSWVDLVTPDADLIDVMVERANYLSVAQQIWRYACPDRECRAALLRAMLQYRLSGEVGFDQQAGDYRQAYRAGLERNWQRSWPDGLALAKSRIPNRDPFSPESPRYELDPLFERPARAVWRQADAVLAQGVVYRLARFLTRADIRRLDRYLVAASERNPGQPTVIRAECRLANQASPANLLVCASPANRDGLRATLEIEGGDRIDALRIVSLSVPGDRNIWQPEVARIEASGNGLHIDVEADRAGLSARLSNGSRIQSLRLIGDDNNDAGWLEITIVDDFAPVERALSKLLREGDRSLSSGPFRRDRVMPALMRKLGMAALDWPREASSRVPRQTAAPIALAGNLALLDPYCAHCHGDDTRHPPGFLNGADAYSRVVRCAPRIVSRLAAWRQFPELERSPMPPSASLPVSGTDAERWPQSDHYRALYQAVETLLDRDYSGIAYDDLPACLAD